MQCLARNHMNTNTRLRWICGPVVFITLVFSSPAIGDAPRPVASKRTGTPRTITIVDRRGLPVASGERTEQSQIFDVTVGPGGSTVFSPSTANISAGDTVR